ncbi:pectinesterase family protein [Jeotgalibaca porci]|uniref:pectinesterase family protein n=1 Tax=Jeotgalibaca porci TaxID=1868793 RepID=UPI0035A0C483
MTEIINIIDDTEVIDNRYYSPTSGVLLTGDNTTSAYPLTRLSAGKYYHYSNIGENFSFGLVIFDDAKGFVKRVTVTELMADGYFQMENDGYVGVSVLNASLNRVALVEEKYGSYLITPSSPLNTIPPHLNIKKKIIKTNTVIVDKNGNGDFTTINAAIMSIRDDDIMNKYTIIINPGTYNEVIDLKHKRFISLTGVNKKTCIIRNDNGTYEESPIQISGEAVIKNLTVMSTHDNNLTLDPAGNKGYAIHADYNNGGNGGTLIIEDCVLISYNSSALGCGTYADQTIECVNTEFISTLPPNYLPKYGAVFAHSSNSAATNQHFKMRNCKITSNSDYSAFFANSDNSTLNFELINNNFYSSVNGKSDESILESKNPIYNARSFGNNVSKLNK